MSRWIDFATWPRRSHYEFWQDYEVPYFNLCTEVEAEATRRMCSETGQSFFLACWYAVSEAANAEETFRLRIRDEGIWLHDRIRIATTALAPDDTVRFCHLPAEPAWPQFALSARAAIETALTTEQSGLDDRPDDDGVIHGTVIPWIRFSAVQHPRRLSRTDSIPTIALGRCEARADGSAPLPVSVEGHHGIMDGLHVARFLDGLADRLTHPERWLVPSRDA